MSTTQGLEHNLVTNGDGRDVELPAASLTSWRYSVIKSSSSSIEEGRRRDD